MQKSKSSRFKDNFRELLNFVSDSIMVINKEGLVLAANKTASSLLGLPLEELIGNNIKDLKIIDEKTNDILRKQLQKRIEGEKIDKYEIPALVNGQSKYFEPEGKRIDYFGEPADIVILRDITEKRKIQGQLLVKIAQMDEQYQESEGRYRKLFQESTDALFIADAETGAIIDCNNAATLLVAFEKSEIIGKNYSTLRSQMLVKENITKELKEKAKDSQKTPIETQILTKTGERKFVSIRVSFFQFQGKKLIQGTFRDITERKLMQQALIENEEKFRGIANSVKDAVILINEKGKIIYWNPAAEKTFNYTSKEAICKDIHKLVVPNKMCNEGKERINSSMKVFTETGTGYFTVGNVELVGRHKDGSEFPAELSISPIRLCGKWNALGVVKDITERKKGEQKLREAEQRYHALFNEAPLGVLVIDPETAAFVEFNDTAHLQLAYSREEFSQLTIYDLEAKETPNEIRAHIDELLRENKGEFETLHRTKNGDLKNILVTPRIIELAGKKLLHCIYHDITERKQLENDLQSSEGRFRAITNSAMDAIILVDEEDKIIYWNPAAEKTFGYGEAEVMGQKLSELVIPLRGHKTHEELLDELKHNSFSKKHFEYSALRKNGKEFPVDLSISSVKLKDRNCILAIVRDISEQKQMELSIKQERDMLEGITENIGAGLAIIDKDYKILWTNNYLKKPYGDLSNKICYSTFNTLSTVCQDCGPKKIFEGAQSDSREYFNEDLHKKGMPCWFELIATPIKDKDGKVIAALELTVDITEKKELEEKIREERNKLEGITENISASLMLVNRDYEIIWMNKFAQELHGNIVNQKCYTAIHGKDTICSECAVQKILSGKPIDVHQVPIIKNDKTVILEITATPMKDKNGNIIGVLELGMDLTEIKKLQGELSKYSQKLEDLVKQRTEQLKETQAKLVKSERFAAIGELAGMIGHDLRNPLSGIKNSAYFLKKKGKEIDDVQAKEMLDIIDKCVDYSNKIVSDLLDYSREIHLELQECSPRNLIIESLSMMNVPEKMEIVNNVTDQPLVKVDPDKIKRVFINLMKNGIEASSNVGKLTINSEEVNGSFQISFSDTGVGIPDEILPRLFSPLCTTKAQGMGFGLAICKRIIDAHGGTITAKTANGIGSTFTITLSIEPKTEIGGEKIWIEMPKSSLSTMTRT